MNLLKHSTDGMLKRLKLSGRRRRHAGMTNIMKFISPKFIIYGGPNLACVEHTLAASQYNLSWFTAL